jgi:hypothetical protein
VSDELIKGADLFPPDEPSERAPAPRQGAVASSLETAARPSDQGLIRGADLFPETAAPPVAPTRASGQRSLMGDIGSLFYSSMLDTLASGAAAGEYMAGSGGTLTRWRESLSQSAREAQQNVSQEMQNALARRFIPSEENAPSAYSSFGDFFGALGAQAVSSLGSIVASLPAIGVGLLGGGPVGGMVAGGVTTGLLGMGTVWKDTAEGFQAIPEEDRKRLNEAYRRNRETMSEAEALDVTIREAAGRIPELVGVLSAIPGAIMGRFESQLAARQLGGGVIRNAGRGMLTEGATEFPEEVAQNVGTQVATERLTGEAVSTADALEAGVRGAIGGGAMGGAMGAIGGAFQRAAPPAPANEPPPPAPPAPSTTTQGVDPSLSSAIQQTETPPPVTSATARVDPSLAKTAGWRDLVTQPPEQRIPDPLGAGMLELPPTAPPLSAETTSAPDTTTLGATPPPEQTPTPPAGAVEAGLPPSEVSTEIPTEKPKVLKGISAVQQILERVLREQNSYQTLTAEGITVGKSEKKKLDLLDKEVLGYKAFLDCLQGRSR